MDASLMLFSLHGNMQLLSVERYLSSHCLISVECSRVLTLKIMRYYSSVANAEEEM